MDKYIIGNWKAAPATTKEARRLWDQIQRSSWGKNVHVIVCPPFPFLSSVIPKGKIALGGQDCFWEQGAYTSAVSAEMLKDVGCAYVILGHSERREYFGDTDDVINKKLLSALKSGLRPILAVGEKTRKTFDSRGKHTNELDIVVEEQVVKALRGVSHAKIRNVIIAYEPIWAISKGKGNHAFAKPDDVFMAVLYIRKILTRLYSRTIAEAVPIIYGGSTNSKNIARFLAEGGVNGVLVGNASLDSTEFARIVKIANEAT